ncbi:adenylate kinase isoenzyme 5-like [Parambassis ranga]|uniref:Adenylate kinase isoenzyme 5-like n=1 Tax=Parambassis ranga TaxID=210632 RepID=A0A6P7IZK8_9TELE|nr:adenylate kinase isoenzyme 5-like [Parambassis ranga]
MSSREAKEYLSHHHVSRLLESLLTGLLYQRPDDPVSFLQTCLMQTRQLGGPEGVARDTFIHLDTNRLSPKPPTTTFIKPHTATSISAPPQLPPISPHTPLSSLPPCIRLKPSALPCIAPPCPSSSTHKRLSKTPQTVLPPPRPAEAPPPGVSPPPGSEVSPPLPPPPVLRSQLSIDSDSDMTESSGLQQEVIILRPQRPRPLIIFIIGGPGSGKGSQSAKLKHHFGLRGVSLDELCMRQLLTDSSPSRKWEVISKMMSHGELGAQEDAVSELRRQLIGQTEVRGFVVDGFPRDVHQALSFQEQMGSPDLVMLLLCSNETLRCRLQRRAAQLGLLGDSSHALRRRLDSFQRDIVSVSKYYRQLHLLTQVDADRDEESVFADLSSVITEKLCLKQSGAAGLPECSSVECAAAF